MKKKAEFHVMKKDCAVLQEENKNLKDKVSISNLFYNHSFLGQWDVHVALFKNGGEFSALKKVGADIALTDFAFNPDDAIE